MRNASEAAAYAIQRANSGEEMHASGYCLQFVRECYPMASYYYSAIDAWNGAQYKHPGGSTSAVPPGYPAFFTSSSVYDHVAISIGGGDFVSVWNEEIRICSSSTMASGFGPFLGYSEDLNRVFIPSGGTPPPATQGDDEMLMIQRNKSTGAVSLIGSGWYVGLGDSSVAAWTAILGPPKVVSEVNYDTALACLVQGPTAVWSAKVSRGSTTVSALQELANANTNAMASTDAAKAVTGQVWNTTVKRGSELVPAIQELANANTYSMQADATLDSIVAAFRSVYDVQVPDKAQVEPAVAEFDADELEWPEPEPAIALRGDEDLA